MIVSYNKFESGFFNFDKLDCFKLNKKYACYIKNAGNEHYECLWCMSVTKGTRIKPSIIAWKKKNIFSHSTWTTEHYSDFLYFSQHSNQSTPSCCFPIWDPPCCLQPSLPPLLNTHTQTPQYSFLQLDQDKGWRLRYRSQVSFGHYWTVKLGWRARQDQTD